MVNIYDTEAFINMFLAIYKNWKTKEKFKFEISDRINQDYEHRQFLERAIKEKDRLIGFNNLSYDYPLLHYYLKHKGLSVEGIKHYSDVLIGSKNPKMNRIKYPLISQVDTYSIRHYDNRAKTASLKKIQISMDWWNVKDSDEDFSGTVTDFDGVVYYCDNDVDSTDEFTDRTLGMIQDRQSIRDETKLECLNWSDSKLGEQMIMKEVCEFHKASFYEMFPPKNDPYRIYLKDVVFDWISFETKQFQDIIDDMRTKSIFKGEQLDYTFLYDGVPISIKEGGIHGSLRGKFESDDTWVYMDGDVSSMHPRSMDVNDIYPPHIGPIFSRIMGRGYRTRVELKPKLKDKSLDAVTKANYKRIIGRKKLEMNSSFGKMGDQYSPLYYPTGVYKVTINNQLFVLKWMEFLQVIPDIKFIYVNTDGIVVKIRREHIPLYKEQCQKFADYTKFELEFGEYKRLCIRDVNNYCGLDADGDIKTKGEYVYTVGEDYHKVINFRVSRKAAVDYLLFDKPIDDSINGETNLFLFTGSVRFKKKKARFNNDQNDLAESEEVLEGDALEEAKVSHSKGVLYRNDGTSYEVPPNLRFIYSKSGHTLWKVYDKRDKNNKIKMTKMFEKKQIIDCNMITDEITAEVFPLINKQQYRNYARKLVNSVVPTVKIRGTRVESTTIFELDNGEDE